MLRRLPGSILLFTTFALALFQRTPASAQIEPLRLDTGGYRSMVLYENGVAVGELMRVDTDPGKHSEHYVLWPRYIYPNPTNGVGRARSGS